MEACYCVSAVEEVRSRRKCTNKLWTSFHLTFLSKLLDRVVHQSTIDYLLNHKLLPEFQSAYRHGHSINSAVLKVLSDIIDAIDKGHLALLSLLDLSAAFDTVDHFSLSEGHLE